ncbi:MAG TPA: hypothetical protein VJ961_05980 [Mariprofundaceae bacterium]|nr:hypothetical protein [Mariprofundaceae bacterium]
MGRNRYTITASDAWYATRWIEKKLENPIWLGETRTYTAHLDLEQREEDCNSLNEWCELWLSNEQWTQLKNAIRSSRRRAKSDDLINVTLSRHSWAILSFWAKRDRCTLSEAIERRLGGKGGPVR